MLPAKIETPFTHDDDVVVMIRHEGFIWFETEYETLTEFKAELIIWAAIQLKKD